MIKYILFLIIGMLQISSCVNSNMSKTEVWKLEWRMMFNTMNENYHIANMQFDSIIKYTNDIDEKVLIAGLESKYKLGDTLAISEILKSQDKAILRQICTQEFLKDFTVCYGLTEEKVENKEVQLNLIKLYVDDQAVRDVILKDIIQKYGIDEQSISKSDAYAVDNRNRAKLKEIINEYGFPDRQLVGRLALNGIFSIIQHSDSDKIWQKNQLKNIKHLVDIGDLDKQKYAYLYDRIKINEGKEQRYGTQFANVDPVNNLAELAEIEDLSNLDNRRRDMGLMPINMYKELIFKVEHKK